MFLAFFIKGEPQTLKNSSENDERVHYGIFALKLDGDIACLKEY